VPGPLLALAAGVMWSLGGVFVKILRVHFEVEPGAVACLRCAFAGLVLAWALPRMGRPQWGRVAASSVCYAIVVGFFVLSTCFTTAANAILLQYAYPLLVGAGAVAIFKERLGGRTVLALALGMAGVGIILAFSWAPGAWFGFGSAFALAAFTLLQRSMKRGNPVALSSFYNLAGAALLLPLAWGALRVSPGALLVIAVMGTVQLGVPYVLFIRALRTVPATDVALITLVEPILNPLWARLAVGETPHPSTVAGGALILTALLVRFLRDGPPRAGPRLPPPGRRPRQPQAPSRLQEGPGEHAL
jgi:drug/metabolite transporter (DMT)-like permease